MKLYFAPMEGITGRFFRNAYESVYTGQIEKYFAPFITCAGKKGIAPKDLKELLPENNPGIHLVPQVLVNKPEDFGYLAQALKQIGYDEINLNLGCPSKTVVPKGRGAGFLKDPEALDRFLEAAFEICEKSKQQLSIKTRLGMEETEEFDRLYEIYQRYPYSELILHPRLQKDYYKYPVRTAAFEKAWENRKNDQLIYNGDVVSCSRLSALQEKYPGMPAVMIGRGFLMRPYLVQMLREAEIKKDDPTVTFWLFHDRLYEVYKKEMPGARAVLFKMKELWFYFAESFPVTDDELGKRNKKALKQIKKSQRLEDYEGALLMLRQAGMNS